MVAHWPGDIKIDNNVENKNLFIKDQLIMSRPI